ncbi:hypothetical protein ACEWY4_017545 [Coilia grayii]|uniref:Cadherin domain-containing protein n=1 Tax=Coilia grayii TaxID=363190 RepID=A0ABD1JIB7_9TELE
MQAPFPSAFALKKDGSIVLTKPLDYNSVSSYRFNVEARVGTVSTVHPTAVLALDGDRGINETLIYSMTSVSPTKYQSNFAIDPDTGVLSVVNALNREEVSSLFLGIKILVHIDDVPEAPIFSSAFYASQIYNIAPYKYPVVVVKATDPDVGETETLQYSLVEPSSQFAVEPSSGQVYVVSAAGVSGKVTFRVKVEDRLGLSDITTVEVTVLQSASNNVAIMTLNMAVKTVEDNAPQVEESVGRALGWTVKILSVTSDTELFQREATPKTLVRFIAMQPDSTTPLSKEEVQQRLQSEEERVKQELGEVFGPGVEVGVGEGPPGANLSADSRPTIITLGVFLAIFMAMVPVSVMV